MSTFTDTSMSAIEVTSTALTYDLFTQISESSIGYYAGNGTNNVTTNGLIIASGYSDSGSTILIKHSDYQTLLTRNVFDQYDMLVVCATTSSGSAISVGVSVSFLEES